MMNHTIPIVKSQSYKTHLTPIAPAPLNLAPKPTPVHVLPKPASINESQTSCDQLETQSLPCVITSKQWVLPPRPKAGRKPQEKKKPSNVSKLSSNLTNLNIHKTQSENNLNLNDHDLKNQLDSATEENQKLKNIISRLKLEIESLQATKQHHFVQQPPISPQREVVSTPINNSITSRDVSPTIDPKNIQQQEHSVKRTKRQYRKKKKAPPIPNVDLPTPNQTPILKTEDNTPSPISLVVENQISSNLPNLESIIKKDQVFEEEDEDPHCFKKSKTIKLERSMSLQPVEPLPSQHFKSIGLDRTMSIPMEYLETNLLSRSTTNTSSFDDCKKCGQDSCLCLESGHIDDVGKLNDEFKNDYDFINEKNDRMNNNKNNNNNNNANEENEFDVNFYIKSEFDDDQFLMI